MRRFDEFGAGIRLALRCTALTLPLLVAGAHAQQGATAPAAPQEQSGGATQKPVVLDRVIAIINGDVLLESDVQEEVNFGALQPLSVQAGQNTLQRAAERLINRTLILQQMRDQQTQEEVSPADVRQSLSELRKQIPACVRLKCTTDAGWTTFLQQNHLSEQEVEDRWQQRLLILRFIDVRFRAGIRITKTEVASYYEKTLVPAFAKENAKPPALATVSPRIEEILLQRHVNLLLRDWLKSLRDQGSVQILDPIYGQSSEGDSDEGS